MSGPDKSDATRRWTPPLAGDQSARRQGEHRGGPQSVQPEEPTVAVSRPEEPTVVVPGRQKSARPGYPPSQEPAGPAYPSQPPAGPAYRWQQPAGPAYPSQQPGSPQRPAVEYPQRPAPGQHARQPAYGQHARQPAYGQHSYGPPQGRFGPPGQHGQVGIGPLGRSSRRPTTLVGGGIALLVVVAVVLVLGFWKPGFFVTTKLDISKVQTGVQQVLTDQLHGYGAKNVKDVTCNNGKNPTVKKGDTFTCEASIDGTKRQVTITLQDENGNYEVGRPS
jgi:uncharacterized protein DUF4333